MKELENLLYEGPVDPVREEQLLEQLTRQQGLQHLICGLVRRGDADGLRRVMEGETPLHRLLENHGPYGRPASDLGSPYNRRESAHTHAVRALAAVGLSVIDRDDPSYPEVARRWYEHSRGSLDASTAVAAFAAELTGEPATWRSAEIGVLIAHDAEGKAAQLRVTARPDLPTGVTPDPRTMAFFTGDDDFHTALATAYRLAGKGLKGAVLWSLRTADGPVDRLTGESFGAAFAVAIDELKRRRRWLTTQLRLRRLRSETFVVGRLLPSGRLASVSGYDAKTQVLTQRSRVIVPPDDKVRLRDTGAVVKTAPTWRAAAKAAGRVDRWTVLRFSLAALLLVAGVTAGYAYRADLARERSEQLATATRVAEEAKRLVVGGDGTGLLLAMASDDLAKSAGQTTTVFEDISQDSGSLVHIYRPSKGAYRRGDMSPDGRLSMIATDVGLVQLVDTRTTKVLWSRDYPPGYQLAAEQIRITALAFSNDGTKVAMGTSDRKITVLGMREGAWLPVVVITVPGQSPRGLAGNATSIEALALNDKDVYAAGPDGLFRFRLDDGEFLGSCPFTGKVADLHAIPDAAVLALPDRIDQLAVPTCRKKTLWDAVPGRTYAGVTADKAGQLVAVASHEAQLTAMYHNGLSSVLSSDGPYGNVLIMNTNRGVRVTAAKELAVGAVSGTFMWNVERNTSVGGLRGWGSLWLGGEHQMWLRDGVAELHSSGSDSFAATATFDEPNPATARWAGPHLLVKTLTKRLYMLPEVRTRGAAGRVELVDPAANLELQVIQGDREGRFAAGVAYVGQTDRRLIVWDLRTRQQVSVSEPAGDSPNDVQFANGKLYVAYRSGAIRVYAETASGWSLAQETSIGKPVAMLRLTPEGKSFVILSYTSARSGPFRISLLDSSKLSSTSHRDLDGPMGNPALAVLRDGRIVVAYGAGDVVFLGSDLAIREEKTAKEATYITEVTEVPAMEQVVVSTRLRSYVYDSSSYTEVSDLYWDRAGHVVGADVSPDDALMAVANPFRGDISLWTLRTADRRARACQAIGRELTPEEWATYIGAAYRYRPVCSGYGSAESTQPPPREPVAISTDHVGPYRLGMTLQEVRQAAAVPLDHDETCSNYTFRGYEAPWSMDGPVFYFDPQGRLGGMLLNNTVFGREIVADGGVTIGASYEDLRSRYGDRLVHPDNPSVPSGTVWIVGEGDQALAFELNKENRVSGFRVGTRLFAAAYEFCG